MTDVWTWPAEIGVVGGVIVFVLLLVPILVLQVRRYGRLSVPRLVGAAAVSVYGVALVAYTLLPLPTGDVVAWCAEHGYDGFNLRPLQLVDDVRRDTAGMSWAQRLRSVAVLQGLFNVVLFVPWGVVARRYLGLGLGLSTMTALAGSLLVEVTQYTGVYGLIGCSYRYADIDDVITNTLGGLLGALAAPVVLRWMPSAQALAARRHDARPLTVWRRWGGMLLDAGLFVVLGVGLELAYGLLRYLATGETLGAPVWIGVWLGGVVPFVVVFVLPVLTASGATWGQRLLWMSPVDGPRDRLDGAAGLRVPPSRRVVRSLGGGATWGLLSVVQIVLQANGSEGAASSVDTIALLFGAAVVLAVPFTLRRRGLSGVLAQVEMVDVRSGQLVARG